jgi:hypothetical protein
MDGRIYYQAQQQCEGDIASTRFAIETYFLQIGRYEKNKQDHSYHCKAQIDYGLTGQNLHKQSQQAQTPSSNDDQEASAQQPSESPGKKSSKEDEQCDCPDQRFAPAHLITQQPDQAGYEYT